MKKSKKIIAIFFALLIIAYVFYAIYLLIVSPKDTYIITKGTLSKEDTSIGYIIRNEIVIKEENYENGIYAIAGEGKKVAYQDPIFRYYSDNEKEISNKISELNYQIQELLEKEEKKTSSADIKAIENEIENQIENAKKLNNYQEIVEYKNNINTLIGKKINFIGNSTENKEIKKLIKEKQTYEQQLKSGTEYKTAPMSGIVSYRVDGLEEKLSVSQFNLITEEYLNQIDLKTGQIIGASNDSGKVIDNFKCYIAVTLDSAEAMNAKVGDTIKLRLSNKEEIDAKIEQINEESGKRTIIFKINKMTEDLISHRKIIVDVIWWDTTGLKIPNQGLIEENGLYYVIRNRAGVQSKILVKVEMKTDKFSIISEYTTEELKNLGYDEQSIRNYKKITNYDEILLNSQ